MHRWQGYQVFETNLAAKLLHSNDGFGKRTGNHPKLAFAHLSVSFSCPFCEEGGRMLAAGSEIQWKLPSWDCTWKLTELQLRQEFTSCPVATMSNVVFHQVSKFMKPTLISKQTFDLGHIIKHDLRNGQIFRPDSDRRSWRSYHKGCVFN